MFAVALAAASVACGDATVVDKFGLTRKELLALARVDSFNPQSPVSFPVKNNQLTTVELRHTDPTGTLFATFTFTPKSFVLANGKLVCDTCTVTVTVSVASRLYGFTVGPPDLGFNLAGTPTVVVSYGRYGDRSVFDSSAKYASPAEFESALALWRELAPDVWNPARNSAHTGSGTIASGLDFPGAYLIAAPK